jgi:hypothetical protein
MANELPPWQFFGLLEIHREVLVGDILTTASILIAALTFWLGSRAGAAAQWSAFYAELDRFYAEILRTAIKAPHLRAPAKVADDASALGEDYQPFADSDPVKRAQYDAYAYMVWNFIETVHDRCEKDALLRETWRPVIRTEDALHRGWFLAYMRDENMRKGAEGKQYRPHKFRKEFRCFVEKRQWNSNGWAYRPSRFVRIFRWFVHWFARIFRWFARTFGFLWGHRYNSV